MAEENTYQFLVSTSAVPQASGEVRGHAIRNALRKATLQTQQTSSVNEISQSSRNTVRFRHALTGKFPGRRKASEHAGARREDTGALPTNATTAEEDSVVHYLNNVGRAQTSTALSWFGNGAVDPFAAIPSNAVSLTDALLRYFLQDLIVTYNQKAWFSFALTEPVILNVTLALSATMWLAIHPNLDPVIKKEGLIQKAEAVKATNALVRRAQPSDVLIAAVAKLSHIAGAEGRFEEAEMHMTGLCELIKLRGGVQTCKSFPNIVRTLNWANLQAAAVSGTIPRLPLTHDLSDTSLPQQVKHAAELPCSSQAVLDTETIAVITLLRQIIAARQIGSASSHTIQVIMNNADLRILQSVQLTALTDEDLRRKCMLLAAHVFSHAAIRNFWGPVGDILVLRLKNALSAFKSLWDSWNTNLESLLWVLLVGLCASDAQSEIGEWSSLQASTIAPFLGLATLKDAEGILKDFVWLDAFGSKNLQRWWAHHVMPGSTSASESVVTGSTLPLKPFASP